MGKFKIVVIIAAMLAIGGCSSVTEASTSSVDRSIALTEVAQTVIAQLTPPPLTLTAQYTPVPTIAFIVSATPTLTPIPSATPTLPPIGALPVITVNSYSYCRGGPSEQYVVDAIVLAGDAFTPQGISQDGSWWYVAAPKQHRKLPADHCWIYKGITTLSGDVSGLPVVEAPALSTQPPGG
jgi:hypothetical protein